MDTTYIRKAALRKRWGSMPHSTFHDRLKRGVIPPPEYPFGPHTPYWRLDVVEQLEQKGAQGGVGAAVLHPIVSALWEAYRAQTPDAPLNGFLDRTGEILASHPELDDAQQVDLVHAFLGELHAAIVKREAN